MIAGGSGNDTLELEGAAINLDLTQIPDTRVTGIETIDLTDNGDATLVLNYLEVLNLSDTSNTLTITGDSGDHVELGAGWTCPERPAKFYRFPQGETPTSTQVL